ncbi:MAG TPA: cellulose biosynthesis cyclic di-GMP-binding regulatory protein BcsB, partial [Mobilitalea sp.]|nr:cellulose biosynthesis cyclic di-GMP-binding regulatory protein BcsB [Mobilitalea sp.]
NKVYASQADITVGELPKTGDLLTAGELPKTNKLPETEDLLETEDLTEIEELTDGEESSGTKQEEAVQEDTSEKKNTEATSASEITEASEKQPGIIDAIMNSNNINTDKANAVVPKIPETPYQKYFSFETTRAMKGIFAQNFFYFHIPNYWDTKYVYVGIAYEVSSLVTDDVPATLTFLINGLPIYSCFIEYSKGEEQKAYFAIPIDKINEGFNLLEISSYVKIYSSEGCSEDQSMSNWVNIDANSFIYAGYDLVSNEKQINYYPYPFISTINPTGENTGIIIPDDALNGEIAAAMYLMADISTDTTDLNEISISLYKDMASKGITNKIVVSTTENLPQEMKRYLQIDLANSVPGADTYNLAQQTMVRYVEDELGNPLLLIVADDEDNLMEAAHMLMDEERVSQEKSTLTFVQEGSANIVIESRRLNQLVAGSYTIENIIGGGMTFLGPFHNEQILYLPFGNDYTLSTDGKISLKFRYSENLDFNRSMITVYWGDIPIASKKLDKKNAHADELTFTMPADVVGTKGSSIKIAFDLEIKDVFCSIRQEQMPWAYIASDSMLYLPAREKNVLSFEYSPAPFQNTGIFDKVLLVVGDELLEEELELMGKTIAIYGYQVAPYGSLKVIRAREFDEKDADYNIISVGTLKNSFISMINSYMYFKLNEEGDAFLSNSKLVLSGEYARNIASFQLLESPFAKYRAIVIVGSTGNMATKLAHNFLMNNNERWSLRGDCVLVDRDFDLKSFVFIDAKERENKLSIKQFVEENKKPLIFTIMSASAMI